MNFLAHLYLSGEIGPRMVGNFIGDFVKGKGYERYSPQIQEGILLHRKIDAYTDKHLLVKQSTMRFKPCYNRYASVVIDVVYDHFLASLWNEYSDIPLSKFVTNVHTCLIKNYFTLPARVKGFLPFLIKSRRLESYQYLSGIENTLTIMSRNSSLPDYSSSAISVIEKDYDELKNEFQAYFKELQEVVRSRSIDR